MIMHLTNHSLEVPNQRSHLYHKSTHSTPTTSTSGNSSPIPTGIIPSDISPGKHIDLCSQSMQQLALWHFLYEKAVVDEDEYKKLQNNILSDIKHF